MCSSDITESDIIGEILTFDEFSRFYHFEREPIRSSIPIKWKIDPLCKGFAAQWTNANNTIHIELRHHPKTRNDAFLVAHEIMHVIKQKIDKQYLNFTKVDNAILQKYTIDDMVDFASRVGSMFDDPIVDLFLMSVYGFDPIHHYVDVVIPDTIRSLNSRGDATDDLDRMNQAMFYAQYALQWDAIKDERALRKWRALKRQYQKRRPIARRMGEELYHMAKEIGFDTLEKQKALFYKIGDKYTLNGIKIKDVFDVE